MGLCLQYVQQLVLRFFAEKTDNLSRTSVCFLTRVSFTDQRLFPPPSAGSFFRCRFSVEPKVSQCACQIHWQQQLHLESFLFLMGAVHQDCGCECDWCDRLGSIRWSDMCKNLATFSQECACEKVDLLEGDSDEEVEFWGRKPACSAMKCSECGFGKRGGIPTNYTAMAKHKDKLVGWIRFEDQTMPDGKVHKKQQLPQTGRLEDLWEEFMAHSAKVIPAIIRKAGYCLPSRFILEICGTLWLCSRMYVLRKINHLRAKCCVYNSPSPTPPVSFLPVVLSPFVSVHGASCLGQVAASSPQDVHGYTSPG